MNRSPLIWKEGRIRGTTRIGYTSTPATHSNGSIWPKSSTLSYVSSWKLRRHTDVLWPQGRGDYRQARYSQLSSEKKFNFLQPSEAACWLTLCVKIDSSCFLSPCSLPPPPSFSLSPSLPICLPLTSALTWSRIQSKRGFVLSHRTVSLIGLVSAPEVSMWTTFYLSSSAVSSDNIRGSGGYES